jgi:hypothetical protein
MVVIKLWCINQSATFDQTLTFDFQTRIRQDPRSMQNKTTSNPIFTPSD